MVGVEREDRNGMEIVDLIRVSKRFGDVWAVNDITLSVAHGEFVTLLGPSGCGKTTTLRLIAGLERPSSGEIRICGQLVDDGRGVFVPPQKRGIGMVFQSYALWPHMTVFANVAYPLRIKGVPKNQVRKRVTEVLRAMQIERLADRWPHQLSGGQQQRVALARALVSEPTVLLLDEPLSNLDAKLRQLMRFEIREVQRMRAITVVYVTHDQSEALTMSDRIAVMNAGRIIQLGTPKEIYNSPKDQFVAAFIGLANLLPIKVVEKAASEGIWKIRFRCEGIDTAAECQAPMPPPSNEVLLMVRPENVRIGPPSYGWKGHVIRVAYCGDYEDIWVRVGPYELRARRASSEFPTVGEGDEVGVRFGVCWFLPMRAKNGYE